MINKVKSIKSTITKLLTDVPRLRDSDSKLIATIWYSQISKEKIDKMSAFDFLQHFADGKISNPEACRRSRQKIQEQNPMLRGKSYKARKAHAKEMKKQIHTL